LNNDSANQASSALKVAAAVVALLAIIGAGYSARGGAGVSTPGDSLSVGMESGSVVEAMRPLMGTQFAIKIWSPPGRQPAASMAIHSALDQVADLEDKISSWSTDSETGRINQSAGQAVAPISPELRELLEISHRWARRTNGAFDVTGGPLFELWNEAREKGAPPSKEAVEQNLNLVDYRMVELGDRGAKLTRAGMKLGFGSIGKGFAADLAATTLKGQGFTHFIIDAGGDLLVSGSRNGQPWKVGVRHPRGSDLLATVSISNRAIATSGDYEQFLMIEGKRYGHIIDPRSGWPVNRVSSVVVTASNAADADALATALSVMGPEEGIALVEKMSSVEALFILEGGDLQNSNGLLLMGNTLELSQ
jgi:thiamine biosynthesis lipoprotein